VGEECGEWRRTIEVRAEEEGGGEIGRRILHGLVVVDPKHESAGQKGSARRRGVPIGYERGHYEVAGELCGGGGVEWRTRVHVNR